MTEGPYYVDVNLDRSDIRSDPASGVVKEGIPLILSFLVTQVSGGQCMPLQGAEVEVWHCDAVGVYSGVSDPGFTTSGQKWLRGSQVTSATGMVTFTTIYPGWYSGRATHIHFMIRPTATTAFTSQLFFDESITDEVHSQLPYSAKGKRNVMNSQDGIYRNGGDQLLLKPLKTSRGYEAAFPIGIDLSKLGAR